MMHLFQYYVRLKKQRHSQEPPAATSPLWLRLLFPVIGLLALIWFLVRVIPKPSRATYPCQRVAFPLASSFVIWLMGLIGAVSFLKRGMSLLDRKRFAATMFCIAAAVSCLWLALSTVSTETAGSAEPVRNDPIGIAKGIFPGRVVWVHDPNATDWDGPNTGDGYSWQPEHTSQTHVDAMVGKAVRQLTGSDRMEHRGGSSCHCRSTLLLDFSTTPPCGHPSFVRRGFIVSLPRRSANDGATNPLGAFAVRAYSKHMRQ